MDLYNDRHTLIDNLELQEIGVDVNNDDKLQRSKKKHHNFCRHIGLLYGFLSSIFFAAGFVGVKFFENNIHSFEVALARMLIQLMGVAPLLVCKNVTFPRKPLQIYWLVCRGVTGSFSVICAYFAVQHIGVGDALAIFFSNPVFTVFFAWMFLREKLSPIDLLLAVFTVSGVVLIVQPSFIFGGNNTHEKHSRIKGAAVALVGAVFAALVYICLKKLKTGIHLLIPIFYYALCGIIISSVSLSILQAFIVPQCRKDRIILFLIGAFAVVGQLFFTKAVQLEKAAYIAIIRSLDVVFSFIFEYFAFGRIPNLKVVAGTMLILSSAVCVAVKKMLAKSNKSQ